MKKLSLISVILLLSFSSYATLVSSTASGGEWNTTSSWAGNNVPTNQDTIYISSTATISITNAIISYNGVIIIDGTLSFIYTGGAFFGQSRIFMDGASSVLVNTGGKITSSSNATGLSGPFDSNGVSIGINLIAYVAGINGSTINGPSGITQGGGVLPVELISFTATLSGANVQISWATASETNNDFFTLERSSDGQNWEIIGEVSGAGTTNIRQAYTFTDMNPIPGMSYYRLKQTDYDGRFEYFTPSVIRYEPDNLLKVFPNPTTDELQITTSSNISQATVSIKNMNGQVKSCPMTVANHRAYITISHLPAGVYLLELAFPESTISQRIIKN